MTYSEAYVHIDNLLDKAGTSYFTENEKNQFLDLAVMEYTKGVVNTLESDAQSMEKVAPLIVKSQSLSPSSGVITLPVAASADPPSPETFPVYHILRAYTATSNHGITIMGYGEYASAKDDPYHKADADNPIGLLIGASMSIMGNTENVYIEYIKVPYLADEEASFAASTSVGGYGINSSEEIVNIAVRKMMLSLEDPRYQLQINELTAEKR
tara:strand:- start:14571 stop:15206 length:636 start_codon:yes stop_codon:yes gene_type:complete